jgi:hypothetical protein
MTTGRFFIVINCFCIMLASCKKDSGNTQIPIDTVPTEIGKSDGQSLSKVIGSSGGSIMSPDNRFEMIIQSGVLSSDISISIESITNMAPGGKGEAYRLSAEDATFNFPVTLVVHYKSDDLIGSIAEDLGIAFQDSTGIWHSPYKFTLDSVAGTVSTTITDFFNQSVKASSKSANAKSSRHFRDHAVYSRYSLESEKSSMKLLEQSNVILKYLKNYDAITASNNIPARVGIDDLPPLPTSEPYPDPSKLTWYVNDIKTGNPETGPIGTGNPTIYAAPGNVPNRNPVQIRVVISKNKGRYVVPIVILENVFKYKLKIGYKQVGSSLVLNDVYTDSAEMNITVTNFSVVISDTINKKPQVDPSSGVSPFNPDCTYSWIPDNIGMINIKGVTGKVGLYSEDLKAYELGISITQGKLNSPHWQAKCNGVINDLGEYTIPPGSHIGFSFYLNDSQQVQQALEDSQYTAKLIPQLK